MSPGSPSAGELAERDHWAPWSAEQAVAEQRRLAAESDRSFFLQPPSPAEEAERKLLRKGIYPQRSVNHVKPLTHATPAMRRIGAARRDPGVRRKPTRAGRTPRPAARTSSRTTRAGPGDDDPPGEPPGVALAPDNLSALAARAWLGLHGEVARG
jgi:hypothetical protein